MNRFLFLFSFIAVFISACGPAETDPNNPKTSETLYFGDSISESGAIAANSLVSTMGSSDSMNLKLSGKILDVCQKKGCWMEMELGDGKTMRVSFKDYAFFVPKDAAGKTAVIDGYAKVDTISVADLKHYAADAGKTQEEIDKISAPEVEITFEASGVILKEK